MDRPRMGDRLHPSERLKVVQKGRIQATKQNTIMRNKQLKTWNIAVDSHGHFKLNTVMSDTACGIVVVACCDVLAGICFDFISIRKFTVSICNLS
jgi:hypothetical protein